MPASAIHQQRGIFAGYYLYPFTESSDGYRFMAAVLHYVRIFRSPCCLESNWN